MKYIFFKAKKTESEMRAGLKLEKYPARGGPRKESRTNFQDFHPRVCFFSPSRRRLSRERVSVYCKMVLELVYVERNIQPSHRFSI